MSLRILPATLIPEIQGWNIILAAASAVFQPRMPDAAPASTFFLDFWSQNQLRFPVYGWHLGLRSENSAMVKVQNSSGKPSVCEAWCCGSCLLGTFSVGWPGVAIVLILGSHIRIYSKFEYKSERICQIRILKRPIFVGRSTPQSPARDGSFSPPHAFNLVRWNACRVAWRVIMPGLVSPSVGNTRRATC